MSSVVRVVNTDSAIALSDAEPTRPIEASSPEARSALPNPYEVYCVPRSVMHRSGRRPAGGDGRADGVEDQFGAQVVGHRPADHLATEGIDDDRQVDEPSQVRR
jgi:hypothetical protein